MKSKDVDAYIARSAEFAQPVLKKLRMLMHKACPQIEETIKWGVPHFEHKGVVAGMAAFKQHAAFGFWKRRLLDDPAGFLKGGEQGMGGRKIFSLADLPPDAILLRYMKAAVALNEKGIKVPRSAKTKKPPPKAPADLVVALTRNAKAKATYAAFPPSRKRDYVEWITGAKQEETRRRRLATAVEWLAEGKALNWKYENC